MAWKWLKLPRLPVGRFLRWRPNRKTVWQGSVACVMCAAVVGAFYVGRQGGKSQLRADSDLSSMGVDLSSVVKANKPEHVVAYIYNTIPITRQELGEYLIERFGAERVEYLINRRIIDLACSQRGIHVTEQEISAELASQLRAFKCTESEFVKQVLARSNKSMYEWREDVIRPQLAMKHYVEGQVRIGEEQLQKAFEAKFGPKVECRMIVLSDGQTPKMYDIWNRIKNDAAEFEKEAKSCFIPALAANAGMAPPIYKHFPDPNIEREAFKLKPGEVSPLIGMPDKTHVILRCERLIDGDTTKTLGEVRNELYHEVYEAAVMDLLKDGFLKLREQARPQVLLQRERPPQSSSQPAVTQNPVNPVTNPFNRPLGASGN